MVDLATLRKHFILEHLSEGGVAVDFTMGNGNDTLFLSKVVGSEGRVYAFDIQEAALISTRGHLTRECAPENYTLICASHDRVDEFVTEPINAGMFNLGYLPGNGNKEVTTMRATTLPAIEKALRLLAPDGVLVVAVYPGHLEGELEGEAIEEYLKTLSKYRFCPSKFRILNSPDSPYFFLIEKSKKAKFGEI